MATVLDEKTPFWETVPQEPFELQVQRKEWRPRFRKVIAFLGITLFALWLIRRGCRDPEPIKVYDDPNPRQRRIYTGIQPLDGEFDLLDLLFIHSTAGSINVGIRPQPADKNNPVPAELIIKSHAGKVSVDFPAFNAPERDYRVSIDSNNGPVDGDILHGRHTSVATTSGHIKMQLTPYAADVYASTLRTSSGAGSQDISLLGAVNQPGVPINNMSSAHNTSIGSLVLRYPREWEGTIEGHTRLGSLQLHGGDLDIIHRRCVNKVGRCVLAKKGNGSSTLNFHTGIGSVDIYFD